MATVYTKAEWSKIRRKLEEDPSGYGLPDRVYGSVIFGSFNIRKLGRVAGRNQETWSFLADVCRHFDLLAVQEIMGDLSGLRRLLELMGPEFDMIVSDTTGVFPGDKGLAERLGFIYNRSIVHRTEIATDITYDRSRILHTLAMHNTSITDAVAAYSDYLHGVGECADMAPYWSDLAKYEESLALYNDRCYQATVDPKKKRPKKSEKPKKPKTKGLPKRPVLKMPKFVSFIRSPFCVSFQVTGHPGTTPYEFMAVNAHLYFGNSIRDRWQEFDALMDWLVARVTTNDDTYYPNYVLMGDLNLDFESPENDRKRMTKRLKSFNDKSGSAVNVNFPFLDRHTGHRGVFRTNARLTETFDQIGLFCRDQRFPSHDKNAAMPLDDNPAGPDYGVFNFVNLFSDALLGERLADLTKPKKKAFIARFEHKVSDHLPLWFRLPLPRA